MHDKTMMPGHSTQQSRSARSSRRLHEILDTPPSSSYAFMRASLQEWQIARNLLDQQAER